MTHSARWTLAVALLAATGVALVLGFVLTAGSESAGSERTLVRLFWANVAVAVLLTVVVGIAALRLYVRLRRGKFGSRLLIKLAGDFRAGGRAARAH
jgi:nitrogen fixation/metabolism regulation signal transduction histidine kinase